MGGGGGGWTFSAVGTAERRRKTREMAWKGCGLAWLMVESTVEMGAVNGIPYLLSCTESVQL